MKKRSPVAVIGLGSRLFQDEAAGYHAVVLLEKKYPLLPADLIYAGTEGLSLLHQFEERKKVVFIDAGNCGAKPGEFRRFSRDEVESRKKISGFSLHEFDLIRCLETADKLGLISDTSITIFCMQIGKLELSDSLSAEVAEQLPVLVEEVYEEIREFLSAASDSNHIIG